MASRLILYVALVGAFCSAVLHNEQLHGSATNRRDGREELNGANRIFCLAKSKTREAWIDGLARPGAGKLEEPKEACSSLYALTFQSKIQFDFSTLSVKPTTNTL